MPDDDLPEQPAPEAAGPRTVRPPSLILAVSLAVVFGILAAVFGVLALGGDDGDSEVEAVRRAAGAAAEAFHGYDYRDIDGHVDRLLAMATGAFRKDYAESFDGDDFRSIIEQTQAVAVPFVKDVYVSAVEDERAEAVVVVDVEYDGTGGPRTLNDLYIVISMVRIDDTWKIDDVTDPKLDRPAAVGVPSGSTTSTSAPVP